MSRLVWDVVGDRTFETGVDHGVLYVQDDNGDYQAGVAWNGLTTVTETPSGADASPQYADNMKYLELRAAEELGLTIEAFTYPHEFEPCDGIDGPITGVRVGQQRRVPFGLCYRTLKGNDTQGNDYGFKLHLVYGCVASPSERAYGTVNDSPEAIAFSWDVTTNPVAVTGFKPSALLTIDSTEVDEDSLNDLMDTLYGTSGADPELPMPDDVIALFSGTVTAVTATAPTYVQGTHTLTIPSVTGVEYLIDDEVQTPGSQVITESLVVRARPTAGHVFSDLSDDDWSITY